MIEPRLVEFQGLWARSKKLASNTHNLFQDLQERLEQASSSAGTKGGVAEQDRGVVDYAGPREALEVRENGLRVEEERVWSSCEQRERRWNLTVHLNQLEPDVEKVSMCLLVILCVN